MSRNGGQNAHPTQLMGGSLDRFGTLPLILAIAVQGP
jgi:hypothetical protein